MLKTRMLKIINKRIASKRRCQARELGAFQLWQVAKMRKAGSMLRASIRKDVRAWR